MNFALSDDQKLIRDSAENFLADASSSAAVRRAMENDTGYDPALWQRIGAELGWCGTHIPEAHGGLGLSFVELTLLMEQMGRRLVCTPFFSSICLAATALMEAAREDARRRLLPRLASGEMTATLALADSGVDWRPDAPTASARRLGSRYVLEGRFRHVPDGASAELLLIPALLERRWALFAVDGKAKDLVRKPLKTLDPTRRIAEVRLDGVGLPEDALLGEGPEVGEGLNRTADFAAIALAAEQLGGAQQCLDLTLAYTAQRVQFGQPVASFQAVKHRCAEMMVMIEAARSVVYGAARVASAGPGTTELSLEAACAKSLASDAFFFCAQEAIQLHGGVGFTWEYDPQLYFKRAQGTSHWFGSTPALHERVASPLLGPAR